jgi:hypothetical protein
MTIKEIVEKYNLSPEEERWLERMISMMMCLRKYERLKDMIK